jgi:hypothetical protein
LRESVTACAPRDLLRRDEANNLMTTPTRTASNLTTWQCCVLRTSRFVSLF